MMRFQPSGLAFLSFVVLASSSQTSHAVISSSHSSHSSVSCLRLRGGASAATVTAAATAVSAPAVSKVPVVPPPPPRNPQAELYQAAYDGNLDLAKEVLALGADPNMVCSAQENMLQPNALQIAAFQGCAGMVELLVANGAQVNFANRHGYTGLHFAALTGKLDACKALVTLGADVGAKDRFGDQPVDRAEQAEAKDAKDYLEIVMKKKGVERAWGGYHIPDEVREIVEDAERFVQDIKKADAVVAPVAAPLHAAPSSAPAPPAAGAVSDAEFIPRFMLDDHGQILPQYSSVADLAYAKKALLEKQGLPVPEFLKIIEMIQADDDEAVSELLKWTPGGSTAQ